MQDNKSISIIARTAFAFARAPRAVGKLAIILATLVLYHSTISAKADSCPSIRDEINTDRPDVTNSSVVTPPGSLQIENGVNFSARGDDRVIDGTNTRLRAGITNCLEVLVDTPTYFAKVGSSKNSSFSDVAPALKWQISPVPGKVDLSAVFGVALPTGSVRIAGPGRAALFAIPVVMGVAPRVGIEWNVHRVLSSL